MTETDRTYLTWFLFLSTFLPHFGILLTVSKWSSLSEEKKTSRIVLYPSTDKHAQYRRILQRSQSGRECSRSPRVTRRQQNPSTTRRVKSFISTDNAHPPPSFRLERRRCAVSASESSPDIFRKQDSVEEDLDEDGMPVKRSLKITTRFIGSLQKHSIPKGKAEKAAAAAAFASAFMAESSR